MSKPIGIVALAVSAICGWVAYAAAADLSSGDYVVKTWTTELGLLRGADSVSAIAQDATGYLWLGTTRGLVRFDGLHFTPWGTHGEAPLPGMSVRSLICGKDGSLWLGFADAPGISRIQGERVVNYSKHDGLPDGSIAAMIEERDGAILAGGTKGLARFDGARWERFGKESGVPDGQVSSLYQDHAGRLWAGTDIGVFRRSSLHSAFEPVDTDSTYLQSFAEDTAGRLWVTHAQRIISSVPSRDRPAYGPGIRLPAAASRLLADSHGNLWVAATPGGLLRINGMRPSGQLVLQSFVTAPRLSGFVQALFEDREHNLWVGMTGGLLRLSQRGFTTDVPLEGLTNEGVRALTVGHDGGVWVATTYAVNRFIDGSRKLYPFNQPLALHTDRAGRIWIVTPDQISRFDHGKFSKLFEKPTGGQVSSITTDGQGDLWLCRRRQGLFRWREEAPAEFEAMPVPVEEPCSIVYADRGGRVWVGFGTDGVALYESGRSTRFSEKEGLAGGGVVAVFEDRQGTIWVSTLLGISRFDNGHFTTVTARNGLPSKFERWIIDDDDGFLWVGLSAGGGIIRFNRTELDKAAVDRNYQVQYAYFDESDGFPSALPYWARPAAVRGNDGRLWFATTGGIALINPRQISTPRTATPPLIEAIVADGHTLAPAPLTLPPRTSTLQVDYSAISLSAASKVRFRYMLEGFSTEWVYAGERRQAFYTNLRPGQYRFRLAATNEGLWTQPETVWAFTLRPAFYQTIWFYALSLITVISLIAGYWSLSFRAMRNQYALVVAERTRVSREIHDTLLQSLGAVSLELEVVATEVPPTDTSTPDALRRLRRQVGDCITETRQSVWDLRSPSLERRDLVKALQALVDTIRAPHAQIELIVSGQPRPCSLEVQEHLLRIGREAVNNAIRHGDAKHIQIALDFRRDTAVFRICDDGSGFIPTEVPTNGRHCGLMNMKERVAQIRGQFKVMSSPGAGTSIEAIVPIA